MQKPQDQAFLARVYFHLSDITSPCDLSETPWNLARCFTISHLLLLEKGLPFAVLHLWIPCVSKCPSSALRIPQKIHFGPRSVNSRGPRRVQTYSDSCSFSSLLQSSILPYDLSLSLPHPVHQYVTVLFPGEIRLGWPKPDTWYSRLCEAVDAEILRPLDTEFTKISGLGCQTNHLLHQICY